MILLNKFSMSVLIIDFSEGPSGLNSELKITIMLSDLLCLHGIEE
jgi:hypothetical protein